MKDKISPGLLSIFRSRAAIKIKGLKLIDLVVGTALSCVLPMKKNNLNGSQEIRRLLVIRPGGIGDAVFLMAVLKKVKERHPRMTIDILCESRNAGVFHLERSLFQKIFLYDHPADLFALYKNRYDTLVDTEQWHYLSAVAGYFVSSRHSTGFATRRLRAKLFSEPVPYDGQGYELDNFKRLFAFILKDSGPADINGCLMPEKTFCQPEAGGVRGCVAVSIGASIEARRLSSSQYLLMIRKFLEKNIGVNLVGGTDVRNFGKTIEEEISDRRLKNFVGATALAETAAVIRRSRAFIGPDSGLAHLACALGVPVIAFFGPGQVNKWRPAGEIHKTISVNLACSPCTMFGYTIPVCHGAYPCLRGIDMEKVLDHHFFQKNPAVIR